MPPCLPSPSRKLKAEIQGKLPTGLHRRPHVLNGTYSPTINESCFFLRNPLRGAGGGGWNTRVIMMSRAGCEADKMGESGQGSGQGLAVTGGVWEQRNVGIHIGTGQIRLATLHWRGMDTNQAHGSRSTPYSCVPLLHSDKLYRWCGRSSVNLQHAVETRG